MREHHGIGTGPTGPRKRRVEHAIVLGADAAVEEDRDAVARYNADDVRSLWLTNQ